MRTSSPDRADRGGEAGAARRGLPVAVAALAAFVLALALATTTDGTNDVRGFRRYAAAVRAVGPVEVYGYEPARGYNHPPLTGYLIVAINGLRDLGMPFPLAFRLFGALANLGVVAVAWSVARRRWPERATAIGVAVALSPILITVAGFHGNTDTILALAMLASFALLLERDRPVAAGAAFAVAIAIKLVPVVALPALLVAARSRERIARLALGGALISVVVWTPALVVRGDEVVDQVIRYVSPPNGWGILELADLLGAGSTLDRIMHGALRFAPVALAAIAGAWVARRGGAHGYAGAAVALSLFLFLTPGWGAQYLVWPVPFAFLASLRFGLAYAAIGGAFLLAAYTHWSGGLPWDAAESNRGHGTLGRWLGLATWALLGGWSLARVGRGAGRRPPLKTAAPPTDRSIGR